MNDYSFCTNDPSFMPILVLHNRQTNESSCKIVCPVYIYTGVGSGGGGGKGGMCPPTFLTGGAMVCLCPPTFKPTFLFST